MHKQVAIQAKALRERAWEKLEARHPALKETPLRATPAPSPAEQSTTITLGRDETGRPYLLPERPRLEHMHVIGATGSGKTNFLEHMIRQDVARGRGVCVVDPHGSHPDSLYRSLLTWMVEKGYDKSRVIHLVDPNAPSHTVGFNPLDRADSGTRFSVIAEAMFEAFERMWGDEDGNSKPTIQRVLTATFTALGEQGLTLAEARLLFDPDDARGIRSLVLGKLQDSYAYDEIEWLHRIGLEKSGKRDFRAEVVGPLNRLAKLTRTEAVRAIVGQTERLIDLREALDEGHIILANLSGGEQVYEQGADLLGRLLTRFIFFHARRRRRPDVPYFLYLDECHRYLSGDLPNLLAEVRKYGLGVTLSHQWLAQLGQADTPIREAVCKGPNLRAVFRIKDPSEAALLAEMVVPLNLEIPVKQLMRSTVVGHRRTQFGNASTGHQASSSHSTGSTATDSTAISETESSATTKTESKATTETHSEATTRTDSVATTETEIISETDTENNSTTVSKSVSETEGESFSDSESTSIGESSTRGISNTRSGGSSTSRGSSNSIARDPPGILLQGDMTSVSNGRDRGESTNDGWATGSSRADSSSKATTIGSSATETRSTTVAHSTAETNGRSHATTVGQSSGKSIGHSVGRQVGESLGKSVGKSIGNTSGRSIGHTRGRSLGLTNTSGNTTGSTTSTGYSEGIEPLYEILPTAVHSKENAIYMAAQTLRSLTTGQALINYVGQIGMNTAMIAVPRVQTSTVSVEQFDKLRASVFSTSPSAIETEKAIAVLEQREQGLFAAAEKNHEVEEPETFRVLVEKRK